MNNIKFITIVNNGYVPTTLNCIESLRRINNKLTLYCYCVDKKAYKTLSKKYKHCVPFYKHIEKNLESSPKQFRTGHWNMIVQQKFAAIEHAWKTHEVVIITDGDIVYKNEKWLSVVKEQLKINDMVTLDDSDPGDVSIVKRCTGLMAIHKRPCTQAMFNKEVEIPQGSGDQVYVHGYLQEYKDIKSSMLPVIHFPNGRYMEEHKEEMVPYLMHFNYCEPKNKARKMNTHGCWYDKSVVDSNFEIL